MPEKQLPTRTDAIAVRPESIPTPAGKTERREFRTTHSKTFLHAEKAADGKEIRTCQAQIGAVCYVSDDGSLRSIDTTIRDLGGRIGVDWAPYQFTLHAEGVGFDFESREGGRVSITLIGIGGEKFDQDIALKPEITDNTITFRDVRPGCDIVFKCLNQRVKTLRILRDANAPREFVWQVDSDKPDLIDSILFGTDTAGNQLELVASVEGNTITETWTGKIKVITDPATRIRSLSDAVAYPVEIDPTVNVSVAANADDGKEVNNSGFYNTGAYAYMGKLGASTWYDSFFRFTNVTIPQGSTINSATLGLQATLFAGSGITGTITAEATDNAAQFSAGARPSQAVKTSATTAITAISSSGAKSYDVAGIVQEIVNRSGWSSGNAINIVATNTTSSHVNFVGFETIENAGTNQATLSITYTAPAAGGTAKNLLLLGCG